jgi:hypothetical protein
VPARYGNFARCSVPTDKYSVAHRPVAKLWLWTAPVAGQQIPNTHQHTGWCNPCLDVASRTISECSAVEYSGVEWVTGLLQFSCYELLLLEAGSCDTGSVWEPRVRGKSTIRSRYQATISEATADWEDLVHAVVICRVYELEIAL